MRKIWLSLLTAITFACLLLGVGCNKTKDEGPKLAFNEGYLTEYTLGDPIMLDEYIDPFFADDYTFTLTCDETGQERDLKMMGQWTTDKPGIYTITYTVNSGEITGTISEKLNVVVPKATWQYSRPNLKYRAGETMDFTTLQRGLNVMVKSYYSYEFFMDSVSYYGQKESLKNMTSYTFLDEGMYKFKFGVKTEDGQVLTADQEIEVRAKQVLAEGAEEWMAENNITTYEYTYVSPNGKVTLDSGYYSNIVNDNVPYFAFNGEEGVGYDAGTYVMTDFTGKNLPQVAFFCDEVTPSYTDGKNGILISNGITGNDGKDYYGTKLNMSRLTIWGPQKVYFPEFDNRGRMLSTGSEADPFPISYHALNENDSYRYIVGIQDASSTHVTVRMLLINLTTLERVCDFTQKLTSSSSLGTLDLSPDYFKGSIVLYGRYGQKTVLDKVYMPFEGLGDIYELDQAAPFKKDYKAQYDLNATANVSDYIDIPTGEYEFKVYDPQGQEVAIDENGNFTFTMSGKYRLFYDSMQENVRASAVTVRVMYDLDNPVAADFYEIEGAIFGFDDWNYITNTKSDFIKEGSQSIEYYTINSKNGSITIHLSRSFMDFVFLSRKVDGISFEVYTTQAASFKLADQGRADKLQQDYTGKIPAETWTTLTITRDMIMANHEVYKDKTFSIAVEVRPTEAEKFFAREVLYIDNVQLVVVPISGTVGKQAQAFLTQNNMEAYGTKEINDDMSAVLRSGNYQGDWNKITNDDVPYIAYKGNYTAGSYFVVDFTGKNVPQFCFFVSDITASLVDGKAGLYIHTGMIKKNGEPVSPHDGGRVTFLGPNKMEYRRPDADGRVPGQFGYQTNNPVNSPLSINGLVEGTHYRYAVGVKEATVGQIVFRLILINLDTNEMLVDYEYKVQQSWVTEEYLAGGNVVMYGRYNTAITLDKVYAAYTGVTDIKKIDKVAEVLG